MQRILQALCSALVLLMSGEMAVAQNYPTKPVKFISPYAPGTTVDFAVRPVSVKLQEILGQPFVMDFKPASAGILGTDLVAKASPDGYTLLSTGASHASMASLFKELPFDLVKDFTAVSGINRSDQTLMVNPSLPARSVKELIALAKARPGKLTYASNGGSLFLAMEMFKVATGTDIVHIPYKSGVPGMTDVVAGVTDMMVMGATVTMPLDKAGKLRILAVTGLKRSPWMPNIPTLAEELGVPNFEVIAAVIALAPAGTPRPIINRLNGALEKVLAMPDIKETFGSGAAETWWTTPEELNTWIRADAARWASVTKAINFQPQQ